MLDLNRRPAVLRPDIGFVLYVNSFTRRVDGGYRASVFEGRLTKVGLSMTAIAALQWLAEHPTTPVDVLHI